MKTNIFYKVAAVTNSSPKLGGESRYSIRRKASVLCTLCAVLLLAACTQDDIAPAYNDAPLTVTATIPGDVWAVASRFVIDGSNTDVPGGITVTVISYSDWTLHYTNYRGQAASGALTANNTSGSTFTLTSDNGLVWAKVNATKPMHLTARCDNGTPSDATDDYTLHTSVPSATAGEELAFPDMKHTLAKFTVNFMFSYNMEQNAPTAATDFTMTISSTKVAADSYDPMTNGGAWPAAEDGTNPTAFTLSYKLTDNVHIVTGSMLLPQQTMGETLTVTYNNGTADNTEDDNTWTIDLSKVAVSHVQVGQMANQLIAGQHLTLNLKAGLTAINTPSDIQIEAFTAADADADDYTPDLGSVAKTYEYDDETNTYIVYDERCIETALANRAVNDPDAAVVSKAPTLAVVNGAETNLVTVQAAIAGKTTIYVLGTELAAYSGTAKTVVGEAICTSNAANSTISLVMPEVTTIGDYAFYDCYALKTITLSSSIENTGLNAFSGNSAEISYNGMSLCIVLGELSIDNAGDVYNEYLPAIIANGSLCVVVDGTCEGEEYGKDTDINMMKSLIQSAIAKGVTGVYVTGTYLSKLRVDYGNQTVLGKAIEDFAIGTIDLIIPNVSSIPQQAFSMCTAIKSLTFGSVITSVGEGPFNDDYTPNCDLTLAKGQNGVEEGENKKWAGYTWKSITLK